MIDKALTFLNNQVNEYINVKTNFTNIVKLTSIVDQEGSVLLPVNTIGMTLVNVEEERLAKAQSPYRSSSSGSMTVLNPEIKLNLFVLFAAHPDIEAGLTTNLYFQGLNQLSYVVQFFQGKYLFNHQNSPELDAKIERLAIDLYTLPIEQQNYLWAAIGAKYMPSVLYRVRLVTVQQDSLLSSGEPITSIASQIAQKN